MKSSTSICRLKRMLTHNARKKQKKNRLSEYLRDPKKAEKKYGEDLKKYFYSHDIPTFFEKLHEHITDQMIITKKSSTLLEDGVYILLEGQLTYVWMNHRFDRDGKAHLFSLAKNGIFTKLECNPFEEQASLSTGYSILINLPFSVIECEGGNIMVNQDSELIKLDEKTLESTQFYQIKFNRTSLVTESRLPNSQVLASKNLFNINLSLHHTFRNRVLKFHHKFQVNDMAIVAEGLASMRLPSGKRLELTKYSLLLPQIHYQVESAELVLLDVNNNPTLAYNYPQQIFQYIKQHGQRNKQAKSKKVQNGKIVIQPIYRTILSMHRPLLFENDKKMSTYSASQIKKRKKEMNLVSKQCENYCIISNDYCRENLKYAQEMNRFNASKQEKLKNPKILFYTSKRHNKENQENQNYSPFQHKKQSKVFNSTHSSNSKFFTRYSNYSYYSKDLCGKFLSQRQSIENKKKTKLVLKNKKIKELQRL